MNGTETGKCDVGMVFVHGIGEQAARATLMAWGEPIAADLQRQWQSMGEVRVDAHPPMGEADCLKITTPAAHPGAPQRTYLLTEARWAEAFLVPSSSEVVGWTLRFAPRAIGRAGRHAWRHLANRTAQSRGLVDAGVEGAKQEVRGRGAAVIPIAWSPQPPAFSLPLILIILGIGHFVLLGAATVAAVALIPALAALLGLVLILGLALSWLPVVGPRIRKGLVALSAVLGDATAWTSRPLRAASMRGVVLDQIREMSTRAEQVIVVAHSQGAAVVADACFAEDAPPLDVVVTIGGGVNLLGRPTFPGAVVVTDPIGAWATKPDLRWINVWATWDPVPSGPVARSSRAARERWGACLARADALARRAHRLTLELPSGQREDRGFDALHTAEAIERETRAAEKEREDEVQLRQALATTSLPDHDYPPGPEEWPVSNLGSVIRDHTTYSKNSVQVTSRLAALLQDPSASLAADRVGPPGSEEALKLARNEAYTSYVAWLALFRKAALPASVIGALNIAGIAAFPRLAKYVEDVIAKREGALGSFLRWSTTPEIVRLVLLSALCLAIYLALTFLGTRVWRIGQSAMAAGPTWSPAKTAPFFVLCVGTVAFSAIVIATVLGVELFSIWMYIIVSGIVISCLTSTGWLEPGDLPERRPTSSVN